MSQKSKARRTAIVPRAVFAAAVAIGSVPALAGCSGRSTMMSVAAFDMGFSVAAPRDLGTDGARDGASADGAIDAGAPRDFGPDITFSVALPLDLGPPGDATFTVAIAPDASFSVAAPLDAHFTVAAPPPDAFFSVAST